MATILNQKIVTHLELEQLLDEIVNTFIKELQLFDASIYLYQEGLNEYWLAKDFDSIREKPSRFMGFDPYISLLQGNNKLIVWEEEEHKTAIFLKGPIILRMKELEIALSLPLVLEDRLIGIIHLSNKQKNEKFTDADINFLNDLSKKAVLALINALESGAVRKLYEVRSRQERINALAELAARLSHKFRNPLVSINTFLSLFEDEDRKKEDLADLQKVAKMDLDHILEILDQIYQFSQAGLKIAFLEVDINKLSEKMISSVYIWNEGYEIEVITDFEKGLPNISGDEGELYKVLSVIGKNAVEAMKKMKEKKKLTIKTRQLTIKPGVKLQKYVQVEIMDFGEGISNEEMRNIFNPLYTTRHYRVGLNLAIIHRIVEAHGGYIEVKSKQGEGTSFFVNLPLEYTP